MPAVRERTDLCPGALRFHPAADGLLGRVRLPGGLVAADQLRILASAAADLGDGRLELTSRGNVQIRAIAEDDAARLAGVLADAGLLPSATHERVRNIVASPLAGIDRSTDLAGLVAELDQAICASPRLAELSGRFLFALDDGRGDVARLGADVTLVAHGDRAHIETFDVAIRHAVPALVAIADAFLDERAAEGSKAWRMSELSQGRAPVIARVRRTLADGDVRHHPASAPLPEPIAEPVGPIAQADGGTALAVLAPLGRLTAEQAALLADHAGRRGVRVTPWRSLIVPDLAQPGALAAAAASAGLGVDSASPWYRVTACTGRPGCTNALADVQSDARNMPERWHAHRVHWSGCERRCGRPADTEIDVIATADGYAIRE